MRNFTFALVTGLTVLMASSAWAQSPALLPVQGYVTDSDGAPLAGTHTIRASIFDRLFAGNQVFSETSSGIPVQDGAFVLYVGATGTPQLDLAMFSDHQDLWLELAVDGDVIEPRFRMASVPYAAHAASCGDADSVGGIDPDDLALASHSHEFSTLMNLPGDLADGDDDALGGLSCFNGYVATYAQGQWDCLPLSADSIGSGTLATGRFSAISDLQAEGLLDGNQNEDVVTVGTGDNRYAIKAQADSDYLPSDFFSVNIHSAVATADGTDVAGPVNRTFCSLSRVKQAGELGECVITESGGAWTLTANAGPNETTTCEMHCF